MKYKVLSIALMGLMGICSLSAREKSEIPDSLGRFSLDVKVPLTTNMSKAWQPELGLRNRHIALWASHGRYYNQKEDRWMWQRARIWQTVEDIYTESYVLPFLVPMLENAGAHVLMPRERCINPHELIVDNDLSSEGCSYTETEGAEKWTDGQGVAFAALRPVYKNFENPFREGSFRQIRSVKKQAESQAQWKPNFPETGEYAVYVSYKSFPESAEDARYTIYHKGQQTTVQVNQTMGGGTWIYLGTYQFEQGKSADNRVVLSNLSSKKDKIITADAVKFGGGQGNVARAALGCTDDDAFQTSGYPKYKEGARYWMQWAGVPDSIYSPSQGKDDYRDDYLGRGYWVNWLAGGSKVAPNQGGLNIPVDLSFAFHTDAGAFKKDTIVGTLIICDYEKQYHNGGIYANGASRELAKYLCQDIQGQLTNDIRATYEPRWTKRWLWNKSYSESLWPKVPAALLELLSHHNFTDMRYGLDPRFRFAASRAIYKGMLKFLSVQNGIEYCVQPLAPQKTALQFEKDGQVKYTWAPQHDPLEPTAEPDAYIVYRRVGDGDFDNGTLVKKGTEFTCTIPQGQVCSFKVTAVNRGGESFPSEILSVGVPAKVYAQKNDTKATVLVVNGFDRVSGPFWFKADPPADKTLAGFRDDIDHGVPYIRETNYVGSQKEYRRAVNWTTDDSPGFGGSRANYEKRVIAGNTFDYPAVHGASILKAGYPFVSCSNEAVEEGAVNLKDYAAVDWILGKQKQVRTSHYCPALPDAPAPDSTVAVPLTDFKTFNAAAQKAITAYCHQGGRFFVSGAYVASDLWDNPEAPQILKEDQEFAKNVLKYNFREPSAAVEGVVKTVPNRWNKQRQVYRYYNQLNDKSYVVESPDGIVPADTTAVTTFRYDENEISAGVAYRGADYSTYVLGFPFESICCPQQRNQLMDEILGFLLAPLGK